MDTNDTLKWIIILLLVLCWSFTPFCKKKAIGTLTNEEYFVVNFMFTGFLAFVFWIYLVNTNQAKLNVFTKMSKQEIVWALVAAILSIVSAICLIRLIKNYEVSHIMPQLTPLVIILTLIFGFVVFGEEISFNKILGVLLIVIGLYFVARDKN